MKTQDIAPGNGPEALEALLAAKAFEELDAQEQAYALLHVDSPEEYASMRAFLLQLGDLDAGPLKARPESKEALMAMFASEEKGGAVVWLNSLWAGLWQPERSFVSQPAFAVAFGAVALILAGVFFFPSSEEQASFAEAKPMENNLEPSIPTHEYADELDARDSEVADGGGEAEALLQTQENETAAGNADEALTFKDDVEEDAQYAFSENQEPPALAMVPGQDLLVDFERADNVSLTDDDSDFNDFRLREEAISLDLDEEEVSLEAAGDVMENKMAADQEVQATELQYSFADTSLDSTAQPTTVSPVDAYMYNSYAPDEIAQLSAVTIEAAATTATAGSTELSSRGLEVTFAAPAPVGTPVNQYKDLLELMHTAW